MEQEVVSETAGTGHPGGSASTASPIVISLGQTIVEVEAANGRPKQVFDAGAKKIYVYDRIKITFVDGKVSDIQIDKKLRSEQRIATSKPGKT